MKLSTKILATLLLLLLGGVLYSNIVLKQEYNKIDKSDNYWTYGKILDQPFKHLVIKGGNLSHIAFEPSPKYSVRVLRDWEGYHEGRVKAYTKNDTLFLDFPQTPKGLYEKFWMKSMTLVRIFAPEIVSVEGFNTNFGMFRLKQKNLTVHMSGRSNFEVESLIRRLDTLNIAQKDSSEIVFEMSPEYQITPTTKKDQQIVATDSTHPGMVMISSGPPPVENKEAMEIHSVNADLQGYTLLDLGHAQITSLQLKIADSSAIILSGGALKKLH